RDDFFCGVGQVDRRSNVAAAFGEHFSAKLDVRPFEANDEWHMKADLVEGFDDRASDGVALHDATEDVDEHRFDVLVGEQNAKGFGDLILVRAAADVEKVRRLAAME